MNRLEKYILNTVLLVALTLTWSCSKDEDERLAGKWQLRTIETKDDEGKIIASRRCDSIFFNFQTEVFHYQRLLSSGSFFGKYAIYELKQDSMRILFSDLTWGGITESEMKYMLWPESDKMLHIEKLTNKHLILETEQNRYLFHSF